MDGLGDTIPSPPSRQAQRPSDSFSVDSVPSTKPSLVLPPFPSTMLPGTIPSPRRFADAISHQAPDANDNTTQEESNSDIPEIEETLAVTPDPLDSAKKLLFSAEPDQPAASVGDKFVQAAAESTQDQVPLAFKGHQEATESARLRVPAALLDPKKDSLLDEISQLPSMAPPETPFAESLLAEPKAFESVISGKAEDREKHGARRQPWKHDSRAASLKPSHRPRIFRDLHWKRRPPIQANAETNNGD